MNWSANKPPRLPIVVAVLGIAYPFLVYFSLGRVPAGALVLVAATLAVVRIGSLRGSRAAPLLAIPLAGVCLGTLGLGLADATLAAKTYPVMMSLAFATAFGLSAARPPSLIEIFAQSVEPDPSPAARRYMRKASLAWMMFLIGNAVASAATALWAAPWLWALYNGALSYGLMGLMFAGEWLVRRHVRRRALGAAP